MLKNIKYPLVTVGTLTGALVPDTDDTYDIGSATYEWQDLYLDGVAYIDEIQMLDNEKLRLGTGQDVDIYFDATNLIVSSAGPIMLRASGDADDYLTIKTLSGIPTIFGTGSYTRFGDAGVTSHSLASEDDVMITGKLEVDGASYFDTTIYAAAGIAVTLGGNSFATYDNAYLKFGTSDDVRIKWQEDDANAGVLMVELPDGGAIQVSIIVVGDSTINAVDLGLFDGITQPTIAMIEKDAKYSSGTAATSSGANATMTETGKFTNSVVGDIIRVTAGTNATAGWYWITTVTDNNNVDLDRTWCTGAVSGGTWVGYHDFTMLSADGVCTRITDGAPGDANVEIDRDGWIILDVGQANGRLYWRANNAWHYVDATA